MEAIILVFVLRLALPIAMAQGQEIELSMMDQCVDDMFVACVDEMSKAVKEVYFPREIQQSAFRNAWNLAESCAESNLDKRPIEQYKLTKDHLQAICVYTNAPTKMFAFLNEQVRNGRAMYGTPDFHYHALFFWLVNAIHNLPKRCEITYKRTPNVYSGKNGTMIRFGRFASSSRSPFLLEYGSETCFYIRTCYGAYIGNYSVVPSEQEVLFPPHVIFQIMDIVPDSIGEFKCKKIFVLETMGYRSKLNCKADNATHSQDFSVQLRASVALIVGLQLLIGLLWDYEN